VWVAVGLRDSQAHVLKVPFVRVHNTIQYHASDVFWKHGSECGAEDGAIAEIISYLQAVFSFLFFSFLLLSLPVDIDSPESPVYELPSGAGSL